MRQHAGLSVSEDLKAPLGLGGKIQRALHFRQSRQHPTEHQGGIAGQHDLIIAQAAGIAVGLLEPRQGLAQLRLLPRVGQRQAQIIGGLHIAGFRGLHQRGIGALKPRVLCL